MEDILKTRLENIHRLLTSKVIKDRQRGIVRLNTLTSNDRVGECDLCTHCIEGICTLNDYCDSFTNSEFKLKPELEERADVNTVMELFDTYFSATSHEGKGIFKTNSKDNFREFFIKSLKYRNNY